MKVVIKGFIQTSLLDWDGKIVSTIYTPRCNFRCPYCQNASLVCRPEELETIPFEVVKDYLCEHEGWIDGVCLSGGEPCIFKDLPEFIKEIRILGVKVKLDTNGGFPDTLKEIIDGRLADYIAMDIKAPLDFPLYSRSTGITSSKVLEKVRESIVVIMDSGIDYEFRTTVVPTLHSEKDIERIAQSIEGARKYVLQNFSTKGDILNPTFIQIKPYPVEMLHRMQESASSYVEKCIVRGS